MGGGRSWCPGSPRIIHADPAFRTAHEMFLPQYQRRAKGDITPERALAEAKLNEAETIDDAIAWLHPKERMVALHDRALIDMRRSGGLTRSRRARSHRPFGLPFRIL